MKNSIRVQLWEEKKYKMNWQSEKEAHLWDISIFKILLEALIYTWIYTVAESMLIQRIMTLLKLQ